MRNIVHFIPLLTTVVSVAFASVLFSRWRKRGGTHHLWWAGGLLAYAAGTMTESATTLFGWNETVFRLWYISGALLGASPLAQGSAYLHLPRRWAHTFAIALVLAIVTASTFVWLSPVDVSLVETYRLSGRVFSWQWVRRFSPFINLYAVIFLIGGAIRSAAAYRRRAEARHRFIGNVFIAVGGILPGIGGTATRFGHVEVLYVTEFLGVLLLWVGFRYNIGAPVFRSAEPLVASTPHPA